MTKSKYEFFEIIFSVIMAMGVFALLMYNDITLRKTGEEIPDILVWLIVILAVFFVSLTVILKIKKRKFGEDVSKQTPVTWKAFLKNFIIITISSQIWGNTHRIAQSARRGMIPADEAVADMTVIYGIFLILFFAAVFATEYFSKKKAKNTDTAIE